MLAACDATGHARSSGREREHREWQPKFIVIFACTWKAKTGPKAIGRKWIVQFLKASEEKLVDEYCDSFAGVFCSTR